MLPTAEDIIHERWVRWYLGKLPRVCGGVVATAALVLETHAALASLFFGISLIARSFEQRRAMLIARLCATLTLALAAVTLAEHAGVIDWPRFDTLSALGAGPKTQGRMALITAIDAFILASAMLLSFARFRGHGRWSRAGALVAQLVAFVSLVSSLYETPSRFGFERFIHVSPQSTALLLVASIGVLSIPSDEGLLALMRSQGAGGIVARRLLPLSAVVPTAIGGLCLLAQRRGFVGEEGIVTLLVCANVVTFFLLSWQSATRAGAQDEARMQATRALDRLNVELETRVRERTRKMEVSERRYRTLVTNLPDVAILLFDADLRIVVADGEPLLNAVGLSKKAIEGQLLRDVSQSYATLEQRYRAALTGSSSEMEATRAGRHLRVHIVPVLDERGSVVAGMSVSYDITAYKRAEAMIRESETHFRKLIEAIPQVVLAHRGGKVTYANPSAAKALLFEHAEQMVGKSMIALIDPEDRHEARARMMDLVSDGVTRGPTVVRVIRNDGVTLVSEVVDLKLDYGGEQTLFSIAQDITGRVAAEAELRSTSALWRNMLNSAGYAMIATDCSGLIHEFNAGAQRMLGYDRSEVVDRFTQLQLHLEEEIVLRREELQRELGEDIGAGFAAFTALAERGVRDDHEWTFVRKDGTRFPAQLSITAMRDTGGTITGFLCIANDISAQREAQRQLIFAKEAAEEAMRARTDFLARMSHELRTPINGVVGMLQLLSQTRLNREQTEYVTTAASSAHILLALVNDILDFSKMDAAKLQLEAVDFSLGETLAPALRSLATSAEAKGLEFLLRLPQGFRDRVVGDPLRLQQVLVNLAANALKFTAHGEIEVSARVVDESASTVTLSFAVSDTGIGIDESKQQRIFEAFSQADEGTTRVYGGTGLGLSISADLVRLMGGQLEVESALGKGSRFGFTITLPRSRAAAPLPQRSASLLIVSDSEKQRAILVELTTAWRMAAQGCACKDAVQTMLALGDALEVVIFDGPQAKAAELGRAAAQALSRIPPMIMLVTVVPAEAPPELQRITYVSKPVAASSLLETIERVLSGTLEGPPSLAPRSLRARRALAILLAEDNPTNTRVALGLLGKLGHRLEAVDNGRAAVERALAGSFDLVLMDVQMPQMDGLEAIGHIRRAEQSTGAHLPIIALTAQAMAGDRERCIAAGADGYVPKPLRMETLLVAIDAIFGAQMHEPMADPRGDEPPFDRELFLHRMSGDVALMHEVAEMFVKTLPENRASLANAVNAGDRPAIERAAHALVGMLATVAADPALALARRIEERARVSAGDVAAAHVDALTRELDRLVEALAGLA